MADIIPSLVPDPDNAIYSPRVMGYKSSEKIQGGQFSSSSDLNYWNSFNASLSISNGNLIIQDPPEAGNQPYTSAYQTITVERGRIYTVLIKSQGLNSIQLRILNGNFVGDASYENSLILESEIDNEIYEAYILVVSDTITIALATLATNIGSVDFVSLSYGGDNYPELYDSKWLSDTWFLSYSQERFEHLDGWSNVFFLGFKAGQSSEGWIYHLDLGFCYISPQIFQIGKPEIWVYVQSGVPNLNNNTVSSYLGWVLFKREWVGLDIDEFYNTGISNHTNGQGVLGYSSSLNKFIYLIKAGTDKSTLYIKEDGSTLGFVSI